MSCFYCTNTQGRKELSTSGSSIPLPFSRGPMSQMTWRQGETLGSPTSIAEHQGKQKSLSLWPWYYLEQKSDDADNYQERERLSANWCHSTVCHPRENLPEGSSQTMRQHTLEEELQSQRSKEILPTAPAELGCRHSSLRTKVEDPSALQVRQLHLLQSFNTKKVEGHPDKTPSTLDQTEQTTQEEWLKLRELLVDNYQDNSCTSINYTFLSPSCPEHLG